MVGDSNNETKIPYKLLLSDTHISIICKIFINSLSANIKCSKTLTV